MATIISPYSSQKVRLLIDSGSELSFISNSIVRQLHLHRHHANISVYGIGGQQPVSTKGMVSFTLRSLHRNTAVNIKAYILNTISSRLPSASFERQEWPHLNKLTLADPDYNIPRSIDIILGADVYGQIIKPNMVKGEPGTPSAHLSTFGWLIIGPVNSSSHLNYYNTLTIHLNESKLNDLVIKFWQQEEPPQSIQHTMSQEEQACEDHFKSTHTRDASGRYIVRLPLLKDSSQLGVSYFKAHACLKRTMYKLSRDEDYSELYHKFLKDYLQLNHMVQAPYISPNNASHFYLPHHGVIKADSLTTKLRVVFNGSSPTTSGVSLNDIMHTGQNLLLNITDVLIGIRHHKYLFATDMKQMYRQIIVHEDDRNLQRILWMNDDGKEVAYQLTTVTYGTRAAPFLAIRTLLQLTEDEGHKYPRAVPSLTKARYVDDIFGGAESENELLQIAQELIDLCMAGGFTLAKWFSTSSSLLEKVAQTKIDQTSLSLDDCNTKILGLHWNFISDAFTFTTKTFTNVNLTKRILLSEIAQIFDPLGFVSPVIIRGKIILQELWLLKLSWDEPLPQSIISKWQIFREDLTRLARLTIPRWFHTVDKSVIELHGFSDASQLAMSAVVYITTSSPSTHLTTTSFIIAKTKVAPLKQLTIPRLELNAALILTKLMHYVQATLQLNANAIYMWTDSKVTLTWINSHPSRWKEYVHNRVVQIQELLPQAKWLHVPGSSNPADCASRGLTTQQLEHHELWWAGPSWLSKPSSSWPKQPIISTVHEDDPTTLEIRPGVTTLLATLHLKHDWDIIYKFSSLSKLLIITSLCFRFIKKLKREIFDQPAAIISSHDMTHATKFWIKETQSLYYKKEMDSLINNIKLHKSHPFSRLTAFIDADGIIRIGGRLANANISFQGKHPAILPNDSHLSHLIIDQTHLRTLHGGTQLTLANIRQQYWIIGGRNAVKSHILRCVVCAQQRGIRAHQLMGQLPLSRVTPSPAFSHVGIDYAGPIILKAWKGRGSKTNKGWICVFVCFSTSAIHLEVATDYSTEGFIATYRRFTSRRGIPSVIYTDCGTNFIGADAQLRKMFTQGSEEFHKLNISFAKECTEWKFNPPASPHMGGKWEAVVKSTKFHLKRTIADTLLTYEEYATLLNQIEALLNSRPLEPASDDPEDLNYLTPSHFIIGRSITSLPEPIVDITTSPRNNWHLIQQRVNQFWKNWSNQYLQRLQSISKWHHPSHDITVGSLVLITDERLPPSKWPLARVMSLIPGHDGLTRVVKIKTATATLIRPIAKLAILPIISEDNHQRSDDGGRNVQD